MADDYQCDMCGASFDSQEELEQHNQEEHPEEIEQ